MTETEIKLNLTIAPWMGGNYIGSINVVMSKDPIKNPVISKANY